MRHVLVHGYYKIRPHQLETLETDIPTLKPQIETLIQQYHHGEYKLSPAQQDAVLNILSQFGSTDDLSFDHYETDWDFS